MEYRMFKTIKSINATISINASKSDVWQIWSKFTNVADYIAMIPKSYGIGDKESGLGSCRRCDISEKMQVDERITAWNEGNSFSMEVYESTGLPLDIMEVDFSVQKIDNNTTQASMAIRYKMKSIMKFLPTNILLRKQAEDHLKGLKHHIESGNIITEDIMKALSKAA